MVPFYNNYKKRTIWAIMAALLSILLIVNAITYSFSKQVIEHQFGMTAQSTAVAVSLLICKDLDGYRNFLNTRDETSDYYRSMQGYFDEIKRTGNIRFIYTINQLDDTYIEFILDSEPVGSPDHSSPGDIEEMTDASRQVFLTKQPAILKPTSSVFGVLLGGNAPILDEYGNLLGMVAVSIDNSTVYSALRQLFIVMGITCILLLIFIYFLLLRVSDFFLEAMLRDKLTKAYNRRYFDSLLQKGIEIALKENQELVIFMIDLDHFKKINDTYGHPFGDTVLIKASGLIRECIRREDFLIRYGGEEFVVLLYNVSLPITVALAERIRKAIESSSIHNEEKNIDVKITISIGIANLNGEKLSASELLIKADKALYQAKETRNAVAVSESRSIS
jgi:diguanylate cyclase (GGDEF)-like protein